jgi:tetratricopeptide (TPR) repeat protein
LLIAALVLGVTVGCGSSSLPLYSPESLEQTADERGLHRVVVPYRVDPDVVEWAREWVGQPDSPEQALTLLADGLLSPGGAGIVYRREPTVAAMDVMEAGEANCLSFTMLYVGLARSLGLPVFFLSVEDLVDFTHEEESDLVVISDHIAVGFGSSKELTVIDFAASDQTSYRRIEPIGDLRAAALFYSNRGAEELRAGKVLEAQSWLEDAVRLDPDLAPAWVNLGVTRRRGGDPLGAEQAYREALQADPQITSAYHNLAALLRMQGRDDEASAMLAATDRGSNRNPYSYLALGDMSRRFGRLDEAERFYRRAVRLDDEAAAPLASLGLVRAEAGDLRQARRLLRKARKIDPSNERVTLLARRVDVLSGS